ncbi:MAG: hypothetical protein H0X63_03115 [Flavobacteriales bacterium]|nr:hypothetical protein [Flavobacteriales bacterium]
MNSHRIPFICISLLLLLSCSSDSNDDVNTLNNFSSALCADIAGPTAGYWDSVHGFPLPLTEVPTIVNPGGQFIHSQYPALGFQMPQGYNGFENQIGLGVNMVRNDNQVVWRYVPGLTAPGQVPVTDLLTIEINQLFAFYNFNGNFNVVCAENVSVPQGDFIINSSSRLLRFENITAVIAVNTYFSQSLGSTFGTVQLASGPTVEFDNLIMEVFLPIHWQLLFIDRDQTDSDLDGVPDRLDNFPFDPTRQ